MPPVGAANGRAWQWRVAAVVSLFLLLLLLLLLRQLFFAPPPPPSTPARAVAGAAASTVVAVAIAVAVVVAVFCGIHVLPHTLSGELCGSAMGRVLQTLGAILSGGCGGRLGHVRTGAQGDVQDFRMGVGGNGCGGAALVREEVGGPAWALWWGESPS